MDAADKPEATQMVETMTTDQENLKNRKYGSRVTDAEDNFLQSIDRNERDKIFRKVKNFLELQPAHGCRR